MSLGRHSGPAPRVRRAAGHSCPQCRQPWSLTATHTDNGFLVTCRACDYSQAVNIPEHGGERQPLLETS